MRHMKSGFLCLFAGLLLVFMPVCAAAGQGNSVNYSVRAILPENQLDENVAYFDILLSPGQRQVLEVVVKNKGDEDIEVAVEANTAFSNANGIIEFTASEARDSSMVLDFAEIVTPEEAVLFIPAMSEVTALFSVNMPETSFEGVVFGGLMFTKLHQGEGNDSESGVSIRNIYRYVIGVRIRESTKAVEPAFELLGAELSTLSTPSMILHLRNPKPVIARGIQMTAKIYPQNESQPAYVFNREDLGMAPNSAMGCLLYFDQEKKTIQPGRYRVEVDLAFENRAWQFETDLVID